MHAESQRVAMAPCTQFNSLVASGSRITSIALSTLQSLCAIIAAQSSATTETIVLSPPFPLALIVARVSHFGETTDAGVD